MSTGPWRLIVGLMIFSAGICGCNGNGKHDSGADTPGNSTDTSTDSTTGTSTDSTTGTEHADDSTGDGGALLCSHDPAPGACYAYARSCDCCGLCQSVELAEAQCGALLNSLSAGCQDYYSELLKCLATGGCAYAGIVAPEGILTPQGQCTEEYLRYKKECPN
jgi:hypothetical protein